MRLGYEEAFVLFLSEATAVSVPEEMGVARFARNSHFYFSQIHVICRMN